MTGAASRLRRREAAPVIAAGSARSHVLFRIEAALARIVDETVLHAVDGIALLHHLAGDESELLRGECCAGNGFLIPQRADRESRLAHPRRVDDQPVEIVRIALRLDQSLPSTVGAGVPVGA